MPKFAPDGTTWIPWTIDADQVGGVDVDPSPDNTTTYLRADGTWATPTGGGSVTNVTGTAPISSSGGATPAISLDANGVTDAKLRQSGALSVIGRSANSTGNVADIAASAASDAVLRESGGTLGFGTIATGGIANNAVTLAKLATQADYTWLGNISGGTAVPTATALVYKTTTDPTITSDTSSGFFIGQEWINTTDGRVWVCEDSTAGAAAWLRVGGPPQTMQNDAGTVANFRFDGNVNDSSGSARNLTASGTVYYPGGFGGRKVSLWNASVSASRAENALNLASDMCATIVAFIRPSGTAQTLIQYGANASRAYYVDIAAAAGRAQANWGFWNGAAHQDTQQQIIPDGWNVLHFVRTISGGATTVSIYANGTLVGSNTHAASTPSGANNTFYFARNATGATTQNLNNGMVAACRISTTVPGAAQIRAEAQLYHPYPGICA